MKQLLLSYTQFNIWANQQMIDVVLKLSEEQIDTTMIGSFESIRKTVYHIWSAENIWNQRLALAENPIFGKMNFEGTFKEATELWLQESVQLNAFAQKQNSEDAFLHEFIYVDFKKNHHKNTVWQTIQHVCNHSNFHRGQIVNYLRFAGVIKIPPTDYIHWCSTVDKNKSNQNNL